MGVINENCSLLTAGAFLSRRVWALARLDKNVPAITLRGLLHGLGVMALALGVWFCCSFRQIGFLGFLFAVGHEAPARSEGLQFGVVAKLKDKLGYYEIARLV